VSGRILGRYDKRLGLRELREGAIKFDRGFCVTAGSKGVSGRFGVSIANEGFSGKTATD
jgi:hypothetical protein